MRSLLALVSFVVVVAGVSSGRAQINAEALGESVKRAGWGAASKGSLTYYRGNVDLIELRGEAAVRYATRHPDTHNDEFFFRDRVLVYGNAGFRRVSDLPVANDGYGHLRYTRMQWLRLGGEVFAQIQYDHFQLLKHRVVTGLGIRALVFDADRAAIWFGTGYMVEKERRNIPVDDQPPLGPDLTHQTNRRWNNYVTMYVDVVDKVFRVVSVSYVQPRFDDFHDIQVLQQLTLALTITPTVTFNSDLSVRFDSRAPRSVETTDTRLAQGFTFTF